MADAYEYRIPIVAEISQNSTSLNAKNNVIPSGNASVPGSNQASSQGFNSGMIAGFLIESSKKLLSATGNSQAVSTITNGYKIYKVGQQALLGNYMAVASGAIELAAFAIQKVNELKAEATQNNNTKLNNIRLGRTNLGSGVISVSKDWLGNITYSNKN